MEIEMTRVGWEKLLAALTGAQLGAILEDAGLPKTGKKADLQDRVRMAGLSPRRCLAVLSNEDLYGILGSLPGAKVGGSKPQRLERIIDYSTAWSSATSPPRRRRGDERLRPAAEPPEAVQALHPGLARARRLLPGHRALHQPRGRPRRRPAQDRVRDRHGRGGPGNGQTFNPEVFNVTGVLDRAALEGRMRLFL
jgi:hypothetical protein